MEGKRTPFYIATVLFLIAVLLLVYFLGGRPAFLGIFKNGAYGAAVELDPSFTYVSAKYTGGVAVFGKDGITGISNSGRKAWKVDFPVTSPMLYASGRYVLATEQGGTHAILSVGGKKKQDMHTEDRLITAAVNSRGTFALVTEERGYKGRVKLYSSSGKELYTWHSAEQNILSVAISEDNKRFAVAVVNMRDLSRLCTVLEFDIRKTEPREYVVGDENLVCGLKYNGSELVAVGDEAMYYFKKDGSERFKLDYAGRRMQKYSFYPGGVIALAFWGAEAGGSTTVEFYDSNGNIKGSTPIEGEALAMDTAGRYAAVSTQNGVLVIGKNGKIKEEAAALSSGQSIYLCGNRNRVFLLSGTLGSMYLI